MMSGTNLGQRFLIGEGATYVGRSHDCQVVLQDAASSRQHFRIETEGSICVLSDLGSENGTLVNGKRVDRVELSPGDRLEVGGTLL